MKISTLATTVALSLSLANMAAAQTVGESAPQFKAVDINGKPVALADFKGKYVVLEWMNKDCPFSKKHYNSGNIAASQRHAAAKGAIWLSVSTGAMSPGDKAEGAKLASWLAANNAAATAIIVDDGTVAKAYKAKTTPHMFVIDPQGKLIYAGGIDDKASTNAEDIKTSTNYVIKALDEATAGKPVSSPVTKPYGCSVKYS